MVLWNLYKVDINLKYMYEKLLFKMKTRKSLKFNKMKTICKIL